jgi:hypothetical protein
MQPRALSFLAAVSLALLPACGGTVETQSPIASTSAAGSGGAASSGDPTVGPASVRFANFSAWLAPFDVCAGAEGGGLLAASGLGGGLAFGQVSRYLPAPPGAVWTLVPAGAACSDAAGIALTIPWPAGAEAARVTVVPWEDPSFEPQVTAFAYLDEPLDDQYGINLRVLDFLLFNTQDSAAPVIGVAQLAGAGQDAAQLFQALHFAAVPTVSPMGPVTAAGFVHTPYVEVGLLAVSPDAYVGPLETTAPVPVPPGAEGNAYGVASIFVAGGITDMTARVIVCADDAPAEGGLSRCTTPPQ